MGYLEAEGTLLRCNCCCVVGAGRPGWPAAPTQMSARSSEAQMVAVYIRPAVLGGCWCSYMQDEGWLLGRHTCACMGMCAAGSVLGDRAVCLLWRPRRRVHKRGHQAIYNLHTWGSQQRPAAPRRPPHAASCMHTSPLRTPRRRIVAAGAEVMGCTQAEALDEFGAHFITFICEKGYSKLLRCLGECTGCA